MKMRTLLLCLMVLMVVACTPLTKASYLREYEHFIVYIREHNTDHAFDWNSADKRFSCFDGVWYEKFKSELTLQEKFLCTKYKAEYFILRHTEDVKKMSAVLYDNYNELKKTVEYYIEHNMTGDIELLIKEAHDIGGLAVEALNKALDATGYK
jgi:hypothetical protein